MDPREQARLSGLQRLEEFQRKKAARRRAQEAQQGDGSGMEGAVPKEEKAEEERSGTEEREEDDLHVQLKRVVQERDALKENFAHLKGRVSNLEEVLSQKVKNSVASYEERKEMEQQVFGMMNETHESPVEKFVRGIEAKENVIRQLEGQVLDLEQKNHRSNTLLEKQKEEMDAIQKSMERTNEELIELKGELERSKQEAEEYRNLAAKGNEMPSDRSEDGSRSSTEVQWAEELEKMRQNLTLSQNEVADLHEKLRIAVKKGKNVEEKKKKLEATLQDKETRNAAELEQLGKELHDAREEALKNRDLNLQVERLTKELDTQREASINLEKTVGQITEELTEAKSNVEKSMQEMKDLRGQLDSKERQIQDMLDESTSDEMVAKDQQISALRDEISQLTMEQEELKVNLRTSSESAQTELARITQESDAEKQRLQDELDRKDEEISRLEETFQQKVEEITGSAKGMEELQQQVLEQEKILEDMKETMQSSLDEKEDLKKKLKNAVKKGQKIEKDRDEMEAQLSKTEVELQHMQEKHKEVQEKSANVAQMLERLEVVEQENLALKGSQSESLHDALENLELLQAKVNEIEGELFEQNQALGLAREQTELLLKRNSNLEDLCAEAEAREKEAKHFLDQEKENRQVLEMRYQETHSAYLSLKEQLTNAQADKAKVEKEFDVLKQEATSQSQRCSELQAILQEKEEEAESVRAKLEDVKNSQGSSDNMIRELETQCASHDAVILELENTCKELSERAREYKDQLKAAVRKGKALEKQQKSAEEQLLVLAEWQEKASEAEKARQSAAQEAEELKEKYSKLQFELSASLEERQRQIDELSSKSEEGWLEAKNREKVYKTLVEDNKKEKLELEGRIAELVAATQAQEALEERHTNESASLHKQLLELQAELAERTASFDPSVHEEQLKSLQEELEHTRSSLQHHEADAKELREKLRAAVKKGKSIEKEKVGLEGKVENLMKDIATLEEHHSSMKSDLEATVESLDVAKNDHARKDVQISELQEVARSSTNALETLQSQYAELQAHLPEVSRVLELETELSGAKIKIGELEEAVKEKEEEMDTILRMSHNDASMKEEVENLKAEKNAIQEELEVSKTRIEDLTSEKDSLFQELEVQRKSTDNQNREYETLLQEVKLKSEELTEAQQRTAELEVQVMQLQELSNSSTRDTEDLASQHAELLELLEEREQELHNANERLDGLASELADRDAELAEVQSQAAEALVLRSKALADSQTSAASLSNALERTEQLSQALDEAKSEFDRQLASVNEDYRTRLDKLMNDYTSVQQKLASVEALAEEKLSERLEDFRSRAGAAESKNKVLEQELQQLKQALQVHKEREQSVVAAKPFLGEGDANSAGPFQRRSSRPYDPEANTSSSFFDDSDFKPFTGVRGYQVSRLPPSLQQWVGTVDRYSVLSCVTFRREPVLRVLLMVYLVVVHVILFLYFSIRSLR